MTHSPFKPDPKPSEAPARDDVAREDIRQQEAKEVLQHSFEHGAPETGPGDDQDFERGVVKP